MLPVIAIVLLALIQLAILIGDQIRVIDAARHAARAAAIDNDSAAPARAAGGGGLAADRLSLDVSRTDGEVTAAVRFHATTSVPLVGAWCPDVVLTAKANMPDELQLWSDSPQSGHQ